jgi:hypothetical protein
MSLLARIIRRWKDYLREGRIDAYATLAIRHGNKGNQYLLLKFARLMHVEMNARSDEQLARQRRKSARNLAKLRGRGA